MADEVIIQDGNMIIVVPDKDPAEIVTPQGDEIILAPDEADGVIIADDVDPSEIDVYTEKVSVYESGTLNETTLILVSGEALGVGKLVKSVAGRVYAYEPDTPEAYGQALGFSVTAADAADKPIRIKVSGIVKRSGWGLITDQLYFAAALGEISNSITTQRIVLPVGVALDADTLKIGFGTSYVKRAS